MAQSAPFRVGIVGCGAITQMAHIPACKWLDRVRLVGLVDTDLDQARKLAAEHEVPLAAPSLDDLFDKVDAVILATPPHVRSKLTQQALAHGLHVLCEKPMANSTEECRRMLAQGQQANRTLAIAHTYRFFRNRAYARARYQAGQFGRLLSARVDQGDPYSWPTRTAYTLRKEWVPGGVLFNEGVHIVDMLLWWFGAPERFDYADDSLGGLESNVRLVLHYPEGATVNFRLSRTCSLANKVEMQFEKAKITFPIYNMSDLDLTVGESDPVHLSVHQKSWDFEEVAASQLADFTLTATQGLPSEIPGQAGLAVVEFIEACYESKARRPRPNQMPLPGFTW